MSIRDDVQDGIKTAMKAKDTPRLECLRMVKGALLLKEKEKNTEVTDEEAVQVLRSEVRKRRDSIDMFREHGKEVEAKAAETEIAIIEKFLPQQMSAEDVETKVRAYVAEHPEINHAGKLTGAMKKELGDAVDGKLLNEVCRRVLE